MTRNTVALRLFSVIALLVSAVSAQTTWTGAASTSWNNAANWTAGVPNATTSAILAAAANSADTTGINNAACLDLTLQAGATLTSPQANPVAVHGSVASAGVHTGTIQLWGNGTIATSGSGTLDHIYVAAGTYTVTNATCNSLAQGTSAGPLTLQQAHVVISGNFQGAGVVGAPGSVLQCDGSLLWSTTVPVTTPPETIHVNTYWSNNANWQPASGTVIFDGTTSPQVQPAAGTRWHNLEFNAASAALVSGSLLVNGGLNLRSGIAVAGATIEVGQLLSIANSAQVVAMGTTLLRLHGGLTAAGVVYVPNATMDIDGDVTVFVAGGLIVGSGTHTISDSFSISGTLMVPPSSTVVFDGTGSISVANTNLLPNVQITGTNYTIFEAVMSGNLDQAASAGNLTIYRARVDGNCTFAGSTVTNFGAGLLNVNGNLAWQTSAVVSAPPAEVSCAGSWTSNANFAPTSGVVVFDGTGAQSVSMPAFHWHGLRVAATSQISSNLPVATNGLLDVQGQLTTTGNDVECFGLFTVPGQLVANSATRVRAHAGIDISGSAQAGNARLDVDGALTVAGSLTLGSGGHEVSGSVQVSGVLSIPAAQSLTLDGSGIIDVAPVNLVPLVTITGSDYTCQQLHVGQDLVQQAGQLRVTACQVDGNASFLGSALLDQGNGLLDVRGNITVQASAPVTAPPATIRCGGNWTADTSFAPASGLVEFNATGGQSVTVPSFLWHNLRISAQSQLSTAQAGLVHGSLDVFGNLAIGGSSLQVDGKLVLDATGTITAPSATTLTFGSSASLDGILLAGQAALTAQGSITASGPVTLGAGPHSIFGGLLATSSWTVPAGADTRFLGTGTIDVANTNVLPLATFAGNYTVNSLTVGSALSQNAGRLRVQNLRCLGNASFQGLGIENVGVGLLEIAGNVNFATSGLVVAPPSLIRCGGGWTSNNQFLPASGTLELNGGSPQTMTAPVLSLAGLRIAAGASVSFAPQNVIIGQSVDLLGSLLAPSFALDVRGSLTVAATGSLQLSATGACQVAGSVQNNGGIAGPGTVTMVGNGTISGGGSFPGLRVQTPGIVTVGSAVSLGNELTLAAGTLDLGTNSLQVGGNAAATGGTLRGAPGSLLDVAGSVTMDGVAAAAAGVPDIHCGANWHASSTFVPLTGTVTLAGAGDLRALDGTISFAHLVLLGGVHALQGDMIVLTTDVAVQNGATLDLLGWHCDLTATAITVGGTLAIGPAGMLTLSPAASLSIQANGALRMVGTFEQPARIDGTPGSGYACNIDGAVTAMNFAFAHMGPNGIRIGNGATIAAAPLDLRSGWFSAGDAAPNSCLLHLDRPTTTQLRYAHFDNPNGATFNIRSTGVGHVELINDAGNFTGVAHEDDAGNVIDWLPPDHTNLTSFTAHAAVHRTELAFVTTREIDVQSFRLLRATSAAGPWVEVANSPITPLGTVSTGANYAGTDTTVVDTTRYSYQLVEELLHGEERVLDEDFSRPWPQQIGNTWVVGTNGGYPDLASAVAAAAPGANIVVQAGTYAAFTIDKPVRITPDGSGPVVIDTSASQLLVQNIPAGASDLALYDLQIGGATSPFGLAVVNCDNEIILDGLQVTTATGIVGVTIDDCPRVAVQNCRTTGDPGIRLQNQSTVYLSLGSIDELDVASTSRVFYCDVTPGAVTTAPGAFATARAGVMPALHFDPLWVTQKQANIGITGGVGELYGLAFSLRRAYVDLSVVFPIDMVMLLEHSMMVTAATGLLGASGAADLPLAVPNLPSLWGTRLPMQVLVLRLDGTGRMGTTRDMVIMP